ncbi:hypothetical protein WA171_007136 [Blastocystis sp. BT1]
MSCWEKTNYFCEYLRIKPHVTKKSSKLLPGKTMYLSNHRSWADFFVDGTLCGGASYIARMMVCLGVPGMAFTAWINNYIWLFHRKKNINRSWFTEFFRKNWDMRPLDGVVVYPEGHRYSGKGSLPLKTGVLEVAYNLNVPCQCVLSRNKEKILNEKELSFAYDVPIYTSIADPIYPKDYKTKEEWFKKIQEVWDATLADVEESTEFDECSLPLPGITPEMTHSYPPNNKRIIMFFACVAAILALIVGIVNIL